MTTPIPSNGYPIPPNNPTGQAFWQQTLDNLHGRLVDIKAEIAVTVESLGDDASALALDLVANSVAPQLASLTAEMTALQQAIALAEDQLTAIQNSGVLAQNVAVAEIEGLTADDAQAAIAELLTKIEAEATARASAIAAALEGIDTTPSLFRSARTSNTILGADDAAHLIDITSGTFTQTFDAAAALGDGWFCYIRNSGTGEITLDPDESETIDGLASFVMYPGEVRLLQCDGSELRSIVLNAFNATFTASGTFIKPPGYSAFEGLLWGAGSSGAKHATFVYGGAGGACAPFTVPASEVSSSEAVVIGAGGLPSTTSTGKAGGNSSFLGVTAYGGNAPNTSASTGGSAFTSGAPNNATIFGASGGSNVHAFYGGAAGGMLPGRSPTVWGGGGGGGIDSSAAQPIYGTTVFGGDGGAASTSSNGADGTAPGGGGGSTATGTQSGAGARGELRIKGVV